MIWSEHNLAENPDHDWTYSFDGFDPDHNYWILKSRKDDEEILAFVYHNKDDWFLISFNKAFFSGLLAGIMISPIPIMMLVILFGLMGL